MKNSERNVFVVRGSEDGNLGVFTNVKRAFARAKQYIEQCGNPSTGSYAEACRELNRINHYAMQERDCRIVEVTIERFQLNQNQQ